MTLFLGLLGLTLLFGLPTGYGLHRWRANHRFFCRQLREEHTHALREANVPFSQGPLERNGRAGVFLKRKDLKAACRAMGKTLVSSWRTAKPAVSEAVFINTVDPLPGDKDLQVYFVNKPVSGAFVDGAARRKLEHLVRQTLLPKVGCSVVVHFMKGTCAQPINDSRFHIFVHSTPQATTNTFVPETIFGVRHSLAKPALRGTGRGLPLVDATSNYVFGEVHGTNCLYLNHDVTAVTPRKVAQLALILEKSAEAVDFGAGLELALAAIANRNLPEASDAPITCTGFEPRRNGIIKRLLHETIARATRREIVVENCKGEARSYGEDGRFHVFYNSHPAGTIANAANLYMVGKPIGGETGDIRATLVDNNLYIHGDIINLGENADVLRFAKVLSLARAELAAQESGEARELRRQRFIRQCTNAANNATLVAPYVTDAQFAEAEQRVQRLVNTLGKHERDIAQALSTPEDELGKEFDRLFNIRKIIDVHVTERSIIAVTDTLYCVDPRTRIRHRIGKFHLHLNFDGSVSFLNQTLPPSMQTHRMNAPHVNAAGQPCLGTIRDELPTLIRQRQYASAINMALLFIESVNVNDGWGMRINSWPIA